MESDLQARERTSWTPSEGSASAGSAPSSSTRSGRPQADQNAFMSAEGVSRRASWQAQMSPAERAKQLEKEMKEKAKTGKQQTGKFVKVGEKTMNVS